MRANLALQYTREKTVRLFLSPEQMGALRLQSGAPQYKMLPGTPQTAPVR
jgi:hypothetical protein